MERFASDELFSGKSRIAVAQDSVSELVVAIYRKSVSH